jgi:hypothetical protein
MSELLQNAVVLTGIELAFVFILEHLKVLEEMQELVISLAFFHVNVKKSLETLEALGVLAHRRIMRRVVAL